jgi:dynein heavy chain
MCNLQMWSGHLSRLNFINEQLRSPVAVNIIMNLEDANSTYGQSFHLVKKELIKVCTTAV